MKKAQKVALRALSLAAARVLDRFSAPLGRCALCGHPDARHRLWDAWMDRQCAGETAADLAADYRVSVAYVRAVLRLRPYEDGVA